MPVSAETNQAVEEQIQIRKARKDFTALAIAYFMGVFNDNFFKQAICLMAVGIGKAHFQGNAVIIFSLPFVLFAAPSGWLSDKYSKRTVIVWGKALEILAMVAGAYGVLTDQWLFMFAMLFLMASQSTLVSPALNGAIPELYPKSYVTKANSIVKLVSTSAILAGIAFAGPLIDMKSKTEKPSVYLTQNRVKLPIDFVQTLKNDTDPISLKMIAGVPPELLVVPIKQEKSLLSIIKEQVISNMHKLMSMFYEREQTLSQEQIFENRVRDALLANINELIKAGYFAEELKTNSTFQNILNGLNQQYSNDETYTRSLASTKFLMQKYDSYFEKTEITYTGKKMVAIAIIVIAVLGWLVSLLIPMLPAAATSKKFPFTGPLDTIKVVWGLRADYLLAWTFVGSTFFYSIANLLVLNVNSMGVLQFHFSFNRTSLLVVSLLSGICVGSLLAGKIAKEHNWYKILPPAILIMGLFSILIYFSVYLPKEYIYPYLVILMVFSGLGGGLFIIPMESFCQIRPEANRKGEILAAHNFVDFVGLLLSGLVYNILSELFDLQSSCMAFLGGVMICLSVIFFIAFRKVPEKERQRQGQ